MLKKGKRPRCPSCKASDPISHGEMWWCKSCGRQWVKHPSKKRPTTNPVCRYCGGRTVKNGLSYRCKVCGKCMVMVRVQKDAPVTISDLCRASVIEA